MHDYDQIRQLLIKDHFSGLSEAERKILHHALLTDPRARQIQQELLSIDFPEAEMMARDLDLEGGLQQLIERQAVVRKKKRRQKAVLYIGTAAAAVVLAFFQLWPPSPSPESANHMAAGTSPAISAESAILRTASGKEIVLSDSGQQMISINGAKVSNNNRVLQLAALQGEGTLTGWNTIIVPKRLDYRIELPDGSTVWLNSTTRFRFPFRFDGDNREVYLDAGEAYFKIASAAAQPFIVHTSKGNVQVLGTEFNINSYTPEKVITSLVNGAVAIGSNRLKPHQEAVVSDGGLSIREFDVSTTTSWRQGMHYFNDASISEISTMLSRWFDADLVIDDPAVLSVRFHGSLNRNKPLAFFVENMNLTKEAVFYYDNGKLHCKLPR